MMDLMKHRGPDASGMHVAANGAGALGHRRLSIMDPEGGNQPIYNENNTLAVIANGEIYNFPALRPELAQRHTFRTTNDSEAILHLYEEHGPAAVPQLDGMFAFLLTDDSHIFAARDPIGIKPLYYGEKGGRMVFSSELKAIVSNVDDIREFPPGTYYHSDTGFHTYYKVPHIPTQDAPLEKHIHDLRATLEESVGKRLMSDVPLGAFLSGGLDSSIIAALARRHMDELHTFSVGIEGSNDIQAARIVAKHLGTIHHEYIITPQEIINKLPEIIYYLESFDQDLVRSAIPCYFTSRLAAQHVKVILTGEGADELFAGYLYYKDIRDNDMLADELHRSVASLHNINLQRVDRLTMAHSLEGRVPFLDLKMIEQAFLIPAEYKLYGDPPVEKWILRLACEDLLPKEIVWRVKEQFDEGSGTVDLLANALREKINGPPPAAPGVDLRSPEEAFYFKIFNQVFKHADILKHSVARWADRPGIPADR
jgi:asparagine synthase (glutamine-hydrolysing)